MKRDQQVKKDTIFRSTIFRVVAIIIILVLPINIMTLILSHMVLEKNKEQMTREIQNSLEWNVNNIESTMSSAAKRLISLSISDVNVIAVSKTSDREKVSAVSGQLNQATSSLKTLQREYPWMDLMYFYFPQIDYVISAGYPGVSYNLCREKVRSISQEDEDILQRWKSDIIDDTPVLIGVNAWNDAEFGTIINLERLLGRLNLGEASEGRRIFFINQSGTIYTEQAEAFFSDGQIHLADIQKSSRYEVFMADLDKSDLTLVEIVEWERLMENLPFTITILQILAVAMTILVIPLLLIYLRKWMIQPLNRLVGAIRKIEQGELDYRIDSVEAGSEFERINGSFNQMMDQVSGLKIDVYEKELERKNIRMRYLSQQVQSHFILNAMNILYSYEPEEYPLIQKLVLCISKYFQYIVKAEDEFVLLKQEMEHIKNYFEIQKARYPERFYAIVEYDETLANAFIPPLLIQNFAENAIKHSMKIGNNFTIYVIAERYQSEDGKAWLRIRLADTGRGISDEMLQKIETFRRTGQVQEGMGIGIRNAIERLDYLYSDHTELYIGRDENNRGTDIEIRLPVYMADDEEDSEVYEGFINRR